MTATADATMVRPPRRTSAMVARPPVRRGPKRGIILLGPGLMLVGAVLIVGYLAAFALAMQYKSYDEWGAMLVGPALLLISIPMLRAAARAEANPKTRRLIVTAFVVKMTFTFVNLIVAYKVYGGVADANGYDGVGKALAAKFRNGRVDTNVGNFIGSLGTKAMKVITGLIYTGIGPGRIGGYLFFSWIAFWGLWLFYRAFKLAVPEGDAHRYAWLVLLFPTLLFWPSAIGKEAWEVLCLGVIAYGTARLLQHRRGAYPLLITGIAAATIVRPNIGLVAIVAVASAYLFRTGGRSARLGNFVKIGGVLVFGIIGAFVAARFSKDIGVSVTSGTAVLSKASKTSGGGGGAISGAGLHPYSVMGVLFRPFPFEAHSLTSLASSAEGTLLLGMMALWWRRIATGVRLLLRNPYLLFCLIYIGIFVAGYSAIANFGTLARERCQVYPVVLVFLALAKSPPSWRRRFGRTRRMAPL
jgi:hypothetical protein